MKIKDSDIFHFGQIDLVDSTGQMFCFFLKTGNPILGECSIRRYI